MAETAYRLSIAPTLEPFRPELEHVCGFLDACYFLRRASEAERVLHYGPSAPNGAVAIPAALFPDGVRVAADGLYPERNKLVSLADSEQGGLAPTQIEPKNGNLQYDALGLIFFMLSRIEERDYPECDRYGRFPVSAALFAPEKGRLYPLADRAARDLAAALTGESNPSPRTRYQVMFTHDVDTLKGYHRPVEPLRNALGDVIKRLQPTAAWRRLRQAYFEGEPWSSMRRLMDFSERHDIKSHFYFMGPSDHAMDSPYVLRWPDLLRSVTDEMLRRGHIVGFHPGFHTATDAAEWRRQHDGLENVIGASVCEGRQHVLRYDAAVTPRIWSDAGMTLDCTLAYPEVVGFRTGTCRPHQAYDLVARRSLPLKQNSTAVMEFGMFGGKYRDMPIDAGVADSIWAAEICRKYSGTFVLLFHTGQNDVRLWNWMNEVMSSV